MHQKIAVAVIDDEESVCRALVRLIRSAGHEIRAFTSARAFLGDPECAKFSCVVADLRMPEVDGLQLQERLRSQLPCLSIVFLSGRADISASVAAMKGGAVDFLQKPVKAEVLMEAIVRAARCSEELEAKGNELGELRRRYEQLTRREREVFVLVTVGLLNKQVAAQLGAAEKTIKQHRARVMTKMDAESFADLVRMADRLGVKPENPDFSWARGLRLST